MSSIELKGIPMPPSQNNVYSNGARGRFKNSTYSQYEETMVFWSYRNAYQLQTARVMFSQLLPNEVLHVERFYYHMPYKIITKKGRPVKNDTSNRIKVLDDCLAKMLHIDDSLFWSGSFSKNPTIHPSLGEYVDVKISIIPIPTIHESHSED